MLVHTTAASSVQFAQGDPLLEPGRLSEGAVTIQGSISRGSSVSEVLKTVDLTCMVRSMMSLN